LLSISHICQSHLTVFSLKLQLVTICNRFISFFYKSVFQNFPLVTRIGTISEYTTYIYN